MNADIPVVGHVGLTPQTATALGGFRPQGRTAETALAVIDHALAVQDAGFSLLVIETVPSEVTATLMPLLRISAIGIGAERMPTARRSSSTTYAAEVRSGAYTAPEHGYGMPKAAERGVFAHPITFAAAAVCTW